MQVLALMGFHVSPVGFLSPSMQLQEHIGAIQNPLPLGRAEGRGNQHNEEEISSSEGQGKGNTSLNSMKQDQV